jgi:hypothetical protein
MTAAAAVALAACGGRDPFAPNPANNADTVERQFVVYPLSTATGPRPAAVDLSDLREVRPGVGLIPGTTTLTPNFDFALDLGESGSVRFLPSRLIVDPGNVGRRPSTGFQTVAAPFDSIVEAPESGYTSDSVATTVTVGQSVIVRTESLRCAANQFRPQLYAKFLVENIDAATGAVILRGRVNPNCGFRSLRPGRG